MCVAMSEDRCKKRFIEVTRSKKTDAIFETTASKKPFNIRKVSYHSLFSQCNSNRCNFLLSKMGPSR